MQPSIHRRDFLATSSLAAASCAVGSRSASAVCNSDSYMQFGLVTYQWGRNYELPELLKVCEKAGVLGVELRTEHKHGVEPSLSAAERIEVRKRFADSPVELVGYGSNCQFHDVEPEKLKANIEQCKQFIQLMHDCGGTGVKVKPNGFPANRSRQQTITQIGESLNAVAEYGQGYGQRIRVEVHGKGTQQLPAMRDIFNVAEHDNVFVCWNCNDQDLEGAGLEANFNLVKDRFGDTVHVREMNVGKYPYPQLMKLFNKIEYSGWILLEARQDPKDTVAALVEQRELFEKLTS